jgi:hypothetical protein
MIVKPAIRYLLEASDAQIIVIVNTALAAILANVAVFATPVPALATIQTALAAFIVAVQEAALGGPAQTAIKNAKRADLAALMRLLANYVGAVANGDLGILLLSGLPNQKLIREPVGPLPKPQPPVAFQGPNSGTLAAGTAPVYGAGSYNWRLALNSAPTVYVQTAQTTAARVEFDGLTVGQTYNVAVNAVGASGSSDWSNDGTTIII